MKCSDYGKRYESYNKCEKCNEIKQCSIMTLELIFNDKVVIIA